jgi:hypothetical protein
MPWIDNAMQQRCEKRQQMKGAAPCGECNLNNHSCCRPRLDNTLCTCWCQKADEARKAVAEMQETALITDKRVVSLAECIQALFPMSTEEHPRFKHRQGCPPIRVRRVRRRL